jgi:hypothetical protein
MVSLAAKCCRSVGSTGRISGPRACLTGEFASLRTMNAAFGRVRGGAGECARQNRLRPATDVLTAPRLPNECASFPTGARNFVNDRQGYRTVKITSRLAQNLDPRLRGPLHSTNANNAAACEPHRAVNAHGHALRRLVDLHHHIGARQSHQNDGSRKCQPCQPSARQPFHDRQSRLILTRLPRADHESSGRVRSSDCDGRALPAGLFPGHACARVIQ